ncbi:Transglycosylase [Burkholderiales bacterium JOSHI_001]|nr:Transglycosylase [Burkholderiales bacterium JOSHI_001]
MAAIKQNLLRAGALLLLCTVSLQLYFLARVALMLVLDPQSTSFQRSEAWRLLLRDGRIVWSQQWVDDAQISRHLKRAVIASEDANFTEHRGVEWDALEAAWEKNQRAQARAEKRNEQLEKRDAARAARQGVPPAAAASRPREVPKVIGGSTITQQLAKNLFLSGERSVLRKAQEFAITFMLEALLDKQRILAIYLNNVEWGEGVFGAQAAARHYHRVDAAGLSPGAASRLAVMLPAPKRFEKNPASGYVAGRAATIQARMAAVDAL